MEPRVSIIISGANHEVTLTRLLDLISQETYKNVEVLVPSGYQDNSSEDTTLVLGRQFPNLAVVPYRNGDTPLMEAIRAASGEILIQINTQREDKLEGIDDHVGRLHMTGLPQAIARCTNNGDSLVSKAVAVTVRSYLGLPGWVHPARRTADGSERAMEKEKWREEAVRELFSGSGHTRGQEKDSGVGPLGCDTRIGAEAGNKGALRTLFHQTVRYGYWKIRMMQKHHVRPSFRQIILAASVGAMVLLAMLAPFSSLARLSFYTLTGTYTTVVVGASIATAAKSGWRLAPVLPGVFWCYHFGYVSGAARRIWESVVQKRIGLNRRKRITK